MWSKQLNLWDSTVCKRSCLSRTRSSTIGSILLSWFDCGMNGTVSHVVIHTDWRRLWRLVGLCQTLMHHMSLGLGVLRLRTLKKLLSLGWLLLHKYLSSQDVVEYKSERRGREISNRFCSPTLSVVNVLHLCSGGHCNHCSQSCILPRDYTSSSSLSIPYA